MCGSIKQQPAHGMKHCSHLAETGFIQDKPKETVGGLRLCCKSYLHQTNLCGHGSWNSCFKSFSSLCQRGREIETKTLCEHWKTSNIYTKSLNGKLNWPCEEKNWLSKDCTKLKQTWKSNIGKGENTDIAFMTSIKSLNPNDYSCNRRIKGLIRLKDIR